MKNLLRQNLSRLGLNLLCCCFFAILGIILRASCILGKCSTTELYFQHCQFFVFVKSIWVISRCRDGLCVGNGQHWLIEWRQKKKMELERKARERNEKRLVDLVFWVIFMYSLNHRQKLWDSFRMLDIKREIQEKTNKSYIGYE